MSEQTQEQRRSPLESDRGVTTVGESVISTLASRAADKVEGVYLGGKPSGTNGLVGRVRGSSQGLSVEVGRTEVAMDLTVGIDYGRSIAETIERLRRGITDEVESATGLRVRELNTTISDIVFSDSQERELEAMSDPEQPTSEAEAETQVDQAPDGEETTEMSPEDTGEPRVR